MSKKVLFITSRLLWPIDGGRKMSLDYYCKGLHEQFGYDVYLYCFLEAGQVYEGDHPKYIKEVIIAKEVSVIEKTKNIISKTLGPKKWPMQCSLFYSKENLENIKTLCTKIRPNVVFTEMIRTAVYLDAINEEDNISIANLDDLLSKRYFRQASSEKSTASMAGAYAGKLPSVVRKMAFNPVINRMFLRFEGKRCEKWEKEYYKQYDYVMFTSKLETSEINAKMKGNKAKTLSVGVDYELLARPIKGLVKEKNTISYVGNFKVAANRDTLRMICREILPYVKSECKLYVIGTAPDDLRKKYESERVIFVGRVEDFSENIRKTEVFFSPIAYGTGIKTKIVEAMAMGMPVITNNVGAEGIDGENNIHYIIENEPKRLAASLDSLLTDDDRMKSIGQNAQKYAYEHFRWEVVYDVFKQIGL